MCASRFEVLHCSVKQSDKSEQISEKLRLHITFLFLRFLVFFGRRGGGRSIKRFIGIKNMNKKTITTYLYIG